MARKLFCELCPLTYKLSISKQILNRKFSDHKSNEVFATEKASDLLEHNIYKHNSLILRTLGDVDMTLQQNKSVNLNLAAPKLNRILIKPNETFSFWKLVGQTSKKQGYKTGLTISNGGVSSAIGGGMCQMTNLIHWMILHSPLDIVEHHHHDQFDLFPDFNRQIPFGTGTSIMYNFKDYRVKNNTDSTFQLVIYTTQTHLCGELRADSILDYSYHICAEDEYFSKEHDIVYRNGKIFRKTIDKTSGNIISKDLIRVNHARVLYDTSDIDILK